MMVEFFPNLQSGQLMAGDVIYEDVGETPMRGFLLMKADKSDPSNQLTVIGFRHGRAGAKVSIPNKPDGFRDPIAINAAMTALLTVLLARAEEIRKAAENDLPGEVTEMKAGFEPAALRP